MNQLKPTETYIKYINIGDAFKDKKYKTHIHPGGILMAGGTYYKTGSFEKLDKKNKWTHLMLRFAPFPTGVTRSKKGYGSKKVYDYEHRTFYIKMTNHHIFYKHFKKKSE